MEARDTADPIVRIDRRDPEDHLLIEAHAVDAQIGHNVMVDR